MWVRVIKIDRMTIKRATLFSTNGIRLGSRARSTIIQMTKSTEPSTKRMSVFMAGRLSRTMSVTELLARAVA